MFMQERVKKSIADFYLNSNCIQGGLVFFVRILVNGRIRQTPHPTPYDTLTGFHENKKQKYWDEIPHGW